MHVLFLDFDRVLLRPLVRRRSVYAVAREMPKTVRFLRNRFAHNVIHRGDRTACLASPTETVCVASSTSGRQLGAARAMIVESRESLAEE